MSEENKMTEENKKTIISFIAGLLVGGLLVFIFVEPGADNANTNNDNDREDTEEVADIDEEEDMDDEEDEETDSSPVTPAPSAPAPVTGNGAIEVSDQAAGRTVTLDRVEFPASAGWIGVRDYADGQLSGLLGVTRFNTGEGLVPQSVRLLRATEAGQTYAVVFYSDNGDRVFNLATDAQLSGTMEIFEAE